METLPSLTGRRVCEIRIARMEPGGHTSLVVVKRKGGGQKISRELRRPLHTRRKKSSGVTRYPHTRPVFPYTAKRRKKKRNITRLRRLTLPRSYASRRAQGSRLRSRSQCCTCTRVHTRTHTYADAFAIRCTFARRHSRLDEPRVRLFLSINYR